VTARPGLCSLLLAWLVAAPAAAYTPDELAAAVGVSHAVGDDVRRLAADALEGRGSGTPGGMAARELLIDELLPIGAGLDVTRSGRDAYRQAFDDVRANVLAVVPGGEHADEYVLVGAHYDHFPPNGCRMLADPICNGATDDAAGVAVVLAIGRALRALPTPPARSVVLYPGYGAALVALEQTARAKVAAGPDAFQSSDALQIAQQALDIVQNGFPCDAKLLPEPGAAPDAWMALAALAALALRRTSSSPPR